MPFNLDPPNLGDDSGLFGGSAGNPYDDFGVGMHGFSDMGQPVNLEQLESHNGQQQGPGGQPGNTGDNNGDHLNQM